MNTVTQPDDDTTTTLLAAVDALGPISRQRMAEHDETSPFPFVGKGFSAKKARSGSTPFDQSHAGA